MTYTQTPYFYNLYPHCLILRLFWVPPYFKYTKMGKRPIHSCSPPTFSNLSIISLPIHYPFVVMCIGTHLCLLRFDCVCVGLLSPESESSDRVNGLSLEQFVCSFLLFLYLCILRLYTDCKSPWTECRNFKIQCILYFVSPLCCLLFVTLYVFHAVDLIIVDITSFVQFVSDSDGAGDWSSNTKRANKWPQNKALFPQCFDRKFL